MITLGGDAELELVTWHSRFFGDTDCHGLCVSEFFFK